MNSRVLFLLLFYASGHFTSEAKENIYFNDEIFSSIDIISESQKPGAAFAIRLAKQANSPIRFCIHQECLQLSHQWQLAGTWVDGPDLQPVLIENPKRGWFLTNLHLEKNLFQLRAPFKLRLPTSVRAKIENKDDIVKEERKFNWEVLKTVSSKPWPCQWSEPLSNMHTVSQFGSVRTVPTGEIYSHKGTDLRAKMKTRVLAVADGTVLSAESQVIGGNNINIDHGQGLISRYFHLSEFKAQKNQEVKRGELIALSGATGRVEAPHLHLEMRVRGYPVDPLSTLRLMSRLCDLE